MKSNDATESFNHQFTNLFWNLGIFHQSSYSYTPQQNGIAERKHRHILNIVGAIRFQSQLTIKFGDSVLKLHFT